MLRILARWGALALSTILVLSASMSPVLGAHRQASTHVFVECWTGMADYREWTSGPNGAVEHAYALISSDAYFYDAAGGGWILVGTETNPSWDAYDTRTGVELFSGQFNFRSETFGDFSGAFAYVDTASAFGGWSAGRSTDGAGLVWTASLGTVDATPYQPLPECAQGGEHPDKVNQVTFLGR